MSLITGTDSARSRILARLRAAPNLPSTAAPALPLPPVAPTDLLTPLRTSLEAAHAEVYFPEAGDWRSLLARLCLAKGIRRLLLPGAPDNDPCWSVERTALTSWPAGPILEVFDQAIETFKEHLFDEVDAGLTFASCGIADTGTLVLASSLWQPRTLSLVPPIHFCLLDANTLYPDLPTALANECWHVAMPSNLIFISGPSKTADIQQTLAYGAHGPKELIVIVVNGEGP